MASPTSHHDQQTYRRGTQAAIIGLAIQFVLATAAAFIALWSQSPAMQAVAWHLFGGLPIWIVLILIYNQHRLERVEALEAEQLAKTDARAAALFDEHADQLAIARRRLDNLYKWGLGLVSLIVATYLIAVGLILLYRGKARLDAGELLHAAGEETNLIALTFLAVGLAFVAFIAGRYEAGMTQVREWQLLRGGAGFLMGSAMIAMLAAIAAGIAAAFANTALLGYLALIIPAISAVLGIEVLFNFLLDLYRPRKPGEVPRPAFDSRLLGMLTSPESIAKAIGDTINYQFGFEVSRSWFYQLLSRAVTPLFVFGLIVLWGMSCIVLVGPQQQAIILKMGAIAGEPRNPGIHFKLPYPMGRVEKYDVGRIHQIEVGSAPQGLKEGAALLWTNPHTEGEKEDFLVTAPTPARTRRAIENDADAEKIPGMSLIGGQVVVQYRIKPDGLITYASNISDPARLLRAIAEREVNRYFVTKDIDTLIGPGRIIAGGELRDAIQAEAIASNLGLEVVFVGLLGMHPPQDSEVAAAFHEQIGALQKQQTEINNANKAAIESLAGVAGSIDEARAIEKAIDAYEQADQALKTAATGGDADALQRALDHAKAELDRRLASAQGEASQLINEAMAMRWSYALDQAGRAQRFGAELQAYRQSPSLYVVRNYYQAVAQATSQARKIVLTSQLSEDPILRLDLKDTSAGIEAILPPN
jgi:membrane protease subunit HflK